MSLLETIKTSLHIEHGEDDELLQGFISAAINYAEAYQHIPAGTYATEVIPQVTEAAIIMLAVHFYKIRHSTDGYYADSIGAGKHVWDMVKYLL